MAATSLPPVLLTPPKPTYSPALDPEETHRGRRRHRLTDGDDNANTPTRSSNNPLRLFLARATSHHGHHRPGSTESSTLRGRPRHRSSSPFWSRTTPPLQRTPLECGSPVSVETSLTAAGGAVPVPVPASAIILLRAALAAAGVGTETRSGEEEEEEFESITV
ncbi:hypothetical protein VTJ04DRAFT_4494 [Mycothermus thermophilus]|uniref:uncharacterized protein n=1 Tax=Humicola insolens TaxID=85995 RepID=UPI00374326E9